MLHKNFLSLQWQNLKARILPLLGTDEVSNWGCLGRCLLTCKLLWMHARGRKDCHQLATAGCVICSIFESSFRVLPFWLLCIEFVTWKALNELSLLTLIYHSLVAFTCKCCLNIDTYKISFESKSPWPLATVADKRCVDLVCW